MTDLIHRTRRVFRPLQLLGHEWDHRKDVEPFEVLDLRPLSLGGVVFVHGIIPDGDELPAGSLMGKVRGHE